MPITKSDVATGFNNNVVASIKNKIVWDSNNKPEYAPASHFSSDVPTMGTSDISGTMIASAQTINALVNAVYNLSKIRNYEYIVDNRHTGKYTVTTNVANLETSYKQSRDTSSLNYGIYQGNVISPINWNTIMTDWNSLCSNKISYTHVIPHSNHGNRSRR